VVIGLTFTVSCRLRTYQVIPRVPEYVLRSPNAKEIPLSDVLREYNGFVRGGRSVDLQEQMEVRIENAYYEKGFSRKGLKGYLGTEVARYQVARNGLRLLSVVPMNGRPENDVPVQNLLSAAELTFHYYRLYFELLYDRKTDAHGSAIFAANTPDELNQLSAHLDDPEALCQKFPAQCTIFPEACSVSVEMKIVVNGKSQMITWGSLVLSVVGRDPQQFEMKRLYRGHLTQIRLDAHDQNQLTMPLLPGDQITWR